MKIQLPSLLVQRISAAWRVWIHGRSHWSYVAYSHHAAALADEKGVLGYSPGKQHGRTLCAQMPCLPNDFAKQSIVSYTSLT